MAKAIAVKEDFLMRVRLYDHERGGHRHRGGREIKGMNNMLCVLICLADTFFIIVFFFYLNGLENVLLWLGGVHYSFEFLSFIFLCPQ